MDLKKLGNKELLNLLHAVEKELSRRSKRRRKETLIELRRVAKASGFSLEDLVKAGGTTSASKPAAKPAATKTPRKKAKIKYRDPDNKANTWAGRGRKPLWLEAALKAGNKMEDFAV